MSTVQYNISGQGSAIAFISGATLLSGYNCLHHYNEIISKEKLPEKNLALITTGLSFFGGGLLTFGLYFLVPSMFRDLFTN